MPNRHSPLRTGLFPPGSPIDEHLKCRRLLKAVIEIGYDWKSSVVTIIYQPGNTLQRSESNARMTSYLLFLSSQSLGSQSSILLSSGSITQANAPFSWYSGPLSIAMPAAVSCAIISSRLSTR